MKFLKKAVSLFMASAVCFSLFSNFIFAENESPTELSEDKVLAFPGAEGGGKYSKGARGIIETKETEEAEETEESKKQIEVYHVTNLNDSGDGSLRDALSKEGRIIVFDLDGVINLKSSLKVLSNTTILAQTAPGEGITLTGYDVQMEDASDVIIRYLKVRPTDVSGAEPDGLGGRYNTRVIFDHCSVSWGVDELLTLYSGNYESVKPKGTHDMHGSYYTVSNSISAESLRMSNHFKGAHGYGAIMGGDVASYHHNLLAHHDSRSPRLDREMNGTEIINNVIYDWGQTNSAYGGEPYSQHKQTTYTTSTNVNYRNNYYSYGPSTKESIRSKIFQFDNDYKGAADKPKSNFYVNGNYVYGDTGATKNNVVEKSRNANKDVDVIKNLKYANILEAPFDFSKYQPNRLATEAALEQPLDLSEYQIVSPDTAEKAKEDVLANAGATLPKRDAIDARIIDDVKNHTGRIVNRAYEVGGGIDLNAKTTENRVYTIPAEWITENGLSGYKETDIITSGKFKGYTLIEAYVNDWTDSQEAPTNPSIKVTSPTIASIENNSSKNDEVIKKYWTVVSEGEKIKYEAEATPVAGTSITKFELYDKNELLKTYETAKISDSEITLEPGTHYLTSRAYNDKGEKTQSTEAIVYVKKAGGGEANGFTVKEIGKPSYAGKSSVSVDENGNYTLYGSGAAGVMGTSASNIGQDATDKDGNIIESGKNLTTSPIDDKNGNVLAVKGFQQSNNTDTLTYLCKPLTGNFDISLKINLDAVQKFENQQFNGLMLRETLNADSRMAAISDSWLKFGENQRVIIREKSGNKTAYSKYFKLKDGNDAENSESGGWTHYDLAPYMRIVRYGDSVYMFLSNDGKNWRNNDRQPYSVNFPNLSETVYIGYAVDSADSLAPVIPYFGIAEFSELEIIEGDEVEDPSTWKEPVYVPEDVNHITDDGFSYSESFLMQDTESAKWILSSDSVKDSDGNVTSCKEIKDDINGNTTPVLSLNEKAVQIEIPEKYQTGKYQVDFDFIDQKGSDRSFRIYMDNAVHEYDEKTGIANEMGNENAFIHLVDIGNKVYYSNKEADAGAGAVNADMTHMFDLEQNVWYHYTITGTNGKDDVNIKISKHGEDGKYNPESLSEPVFDGHVACMGERDRTFKQLKFMHTRSGNQYFDNIVFKSLGAEPIYQGTGNVDGKGGVTVKDAAYILAFVLNKDAVDESWSFNKKEADVDGDGKITINDVAEVFNKVLNSSYEYTLAGNTQKIE